MKIRPRNRRIKHSRGYKKPGLKNWGFGTILLIVASIFASVTVGKILTHKFLHRGTPRALVLSQWRRYWPGQSQLSLELPAEPRPGSVEVPESLLATIKQAKRYEYSIKGFKVAVWEAVYVDGVTTDIQQAAEGAASDLKQSEGVSEYHDTVTPTALSGRPALMITGSFRRYDEREEIKALLLADGPELWQVIITYPASDRNASVASRRVLDSVQIESKSTASG